MLDPNGRACAPRTRAYRSSRFPDALDELLRPSAIDGVPPEPIDLQRACDNDAVDDGENVVDVARINAAPDKSRNRSRPPDLPEIIKIGGVAGALAGEDHDVGVEKLDVANELGARPILHDGGRAVLDVSVGKNIDPLRLKRAPVAHRFRGGPFDQALVGDIGVSPLIDANEMRARRARN